MASTADTSIVVPLDRNSSKSTMPVGVQRCDSVVRRIAITRCYRRQQLCSSLMPGVRCDTLRGVNGGAMSITRLHYVYSIVCVQSQYARLHTWTRGASCLRRSETCSTTAIALTLRESISHHCRCSSTSGSWLLVLRGSSATVTLLYWSRRRSSRSLARATRTAVSRGKGLERHSEPSVVPPHARVRRSFEFAVPVCSTPL